MKNIFHLKYGILTTQENARANLVDEMAQICECAVAAGFPASNILISLPRLEIDDEYDKFNRTLKTNAKLVGSIGFLPQKI